MNQMPSVYRPLHTVRTDYTYISREAFLFCVVLKNLNLNQNGILYNNNR